MQILLEIRSGSSAGQKIPLTLGHSLRIGRKEADHLFLEDNAMSGSHFILEATDTGCHLRDLKSSNGTFVNGARITEATLSNGDEIRAGNTRFLFCILPDESVSATAPGQPVAQPTRSTSPAPLAAAVSLIAAPDSVSPIATSDGPPRRSKPTPIPQSPQQLLHALLSREFQPLYALLDAACEPSVLKVIFESKEEHQSLFDGPQGAQLAHFAPYLIRIPPKSALLDALINQAWSKNWGVFLTSDKSIKDLRTHFRQFLMVKLPGGKQAYFRFYDPTVLRLFLPTFLPKEADEFFGPVQHFLMEDEDPKSALHFLRDKKGVAKKSVPLATA